MRVCEKCWFVRKIFYPVFPEKLNASKQKYFGRPPPSFSVFEFPNRKNPNFSWELQIKKKKNPPEMNFLLVLI